MEAFDGFWCLFHGRFFFVKFWIWRLELWHQNGCVLYQILLFLLLLRNPMVVIYVKISPNKCDSHHHPPPDVQRYTRCYANWQWNVKSFDESNYQHFFPFLPLLSPWNIFRKFSNFPPKWIYTLSRMVSFAFHSSFVFIASVKIRNSDTPFLQPNEN